MNGPDLNRAGLRGGRLRAYLEFIAAVLFFFSARSAAHNAAFRIAGPAWSPLFEQGLFLLLLIVVFAAFGLVFDRQAQPIASQGLPLRAGWTREAGMGLAMGWGAAVACVLPLTVLGGIAVVLTPTLAAWGWLVADLAFFALAAMAEEVAFRGYGFQRLEAVVGSVGASLGFAFFYALVQGSRGDLPGATRLSFVVSLMLGLVLSMAYVRTRALWVSWGLNFGWKASRALLFGLTVSGVSSHSPVVEGDPMGPLWLTGGGYGLDASWLALAVLLALMMVVYRATRDLDFEHNVPVIVPGGIAVDLDAAARRQHEAAMGAAETAAPALVQIFPASGPVESKPGDVRES
ncbi:MAG TPA: type II CAAX endopeptidase family protein [Terracidiphilus sp.]|jgi:membrane protease YdiL (CAAX protease family)|nr:type II CAAX endopeptidase family protein [Terracidiphilus sp.]